MKNEKMPVLLASFDMARLVLRLNPDNPQAKNFVAETEKSLQNEKIGMTAKGFSAAAAWQRLLAVSGLDEQGFSVGGADKKRPDIQKDGQVYAFPYWSNCDPLEWLLNDGFVEFKPIVAVLDRRADTRSLVMLDEAPDGRLRVRVNPENPDALEEIAVLIDSPLDSAFSELLETSGYIGNDWHMVSPESVGALTDSPIIGQGQYGGDDNDEGCFYEKMWWFPEYMVKDPIEGLLRDGVVFFDNAEPAPLFALFTCS